MRAQYELTHPELGRFYRLRSIQGEALSFWAGVAKRCDVDPKTIISNGSTFTAMRIGHGKPWCWPLSLKCKKKPVYKE